MLVFVDRFSAMFYTPARINKRAEVAELADAHDSNSCSLRSVGSIPTFGIQFDPYRRIISPDEMQGKYKRSCSSCG